MLTQSRNVTTCRSEGVMRMYVQKKNILRGSAMMLYIYLTIGMASRLHVLMPVRALFLAVLSAQLYEMGAYTFIAFDELLHLIPA